MQETGPPEVTHSLLAWNRLAPKRDFPLLFVGVDGQHSHEVDSPSFFNPEEVNDRYLYLLSS
jgi:hypothetical protein